MSGVLSVFKIISNLNNIENVTEIIVSGEKQKDLATFSIGNKINLPTTKLKLNINLSNNKYKFYNVVQESNTNFSPIKIYKWDILEDLDAQNIQGNTIETNKGWQIVSRFNILIDIEEKLLYIFANKKEANLLVYRLRKEEKLNLNKYYLDLKKINSIKEISEKWGAWIEDSLEATKKGLFGNIKVKENENVKSYNVSYEYEFDNEKQKIDLNISSEGRISSNSKLVTENVIKEIFDDLRKIIKLRITPVLSK